MKTKGSLLLRLALILFAGYIIVMLVQLQMQINSKQMEIDSIQAQIRELQEGNAVLEEELKSPDKAQEKAAQDQGYVGHDDDIYEEYN